MGLYATITNGFGAHRRLIRRLGAMCLVFLGVHGAADNLDDVVYPVLDALDLAIDNAVASALVWLADNGGVTPASAIESTESFSTWIDLGEKNRLALIVALICEGGLDALLLSLAWGRHDASADALGIVDGFVASARALWSALRPIDLERLLVAPTVLSFTLLGALLSALAIEGLVRSTLLRWAPELLFSGPVAAIGAVLAMALLVWRFVPDVLQGALLRSHQRAERAREGALVRSRFAQVARSVRLALRGWWLVLALPLAVAGLAHSDLAALVNRAIPTPLDVDAAGAP